MLKELSTDEDLFGCNVEIDGKTYRICAEIEARGRLGAEEIQLAETPEVDVRNETGYECPYCGYVDLDGHELEEDTGETECGKCGSEMKYVRNAVKNTLGECLEVIWHTAPVRLNEPIKL
ncbi:hypothetical protein [Bacillus thuringiensis]|uniref:hypothetical protein n=1 Tax=Bacillus thuringiensis TaxID=1428 RepID=UPI00210020F9|nr:hypothetical protein [Bacillus thuringiensis]